MINDVPLSSELLSMDNQNIAHMNDMIRAAQQDLEAMKTDFEGLNEELNSARSSRNTSPTNINNSSKNPQLNPHLNLNSKKNKVNPKLSINPETSSSPSNSPSNNSKRKGRSPSPPLPSDFTKITEMTSHNPVTRNLFVWLRMLKLRKFRAERIRNDLANGYVVAEVLSR